MDRRAYELQTRAFKALSHPTRIAILEMMREGAICCCEIEPELGLRQSNIAQHLATLRDGQLVRSYRDGSRVMYMAENSRIFDLLDMMNVMLHEQMEKVVQALTPLEEPVP